MKTTWLETALLFLRRRIVDANWWRVLLIWLATMALRYLLASIVLSLAPEVGRSQSGAHERNPFRDGEVLQYKVKWSFLRLGTVVIRQQRIDSVSYLVRMLVQSTRALPFLDVQFVNQTVLTEATQQLSEETIISGGNPGERTTYRADRSTGQVLMLDSLDGKQIRCDTLSSDVGCYDALGLLMFSRRMAGSGSRYSLPTLNDYNIALTDLTYRAEAEEIDVAAFDRPVRCRKVLGTARWVGKSFAGMKGPFQGWFTDDEAAIPIKASVEIFLGSIVLELESVARCGYEVNYDAHGIASK